MDAIEIGGSRYIKADDAARLTGYATDYIGQLSRSGKISAQRIGRMWYVDQDDIVAHKKGNARSNKQKTREALHQKIEENIPGQIHYASLLSSNAEVRSRVLDASIRYEQDISPLAPVFEEKEMHSEAQESVAAPQEDQEMEDESEIEEVTVQESKEQVFEPQMESHAVSMRKVDEKDLEEEGFDRLSSSPHVAVAVREIHHHAPVRPQVLTRSPLTHIPRPTRAIVPLGSPSYAVARPFVRALVSLALVLGFIFSLSSVFFEQVLVYERGKSVAARPYYQISYGVASFSSVQASVQEGISGISFDFLKK